MYVGWPRGPTLVFWNVAKKVWLHLDIETSMYLQKLPHALNGSAIFTTAEWILPITYHVCQQGQLRSQGESGGGGGAPPCARPQSPKIVKKWPENASREVEIENFPSR